MRNSNFVDEATVQAQECRCVFSRQVISLRCQAFKWPGAIMTMWLSCLLTGQSLPLRIWPGVITCLKQVFYKIETLEMHQTSSKKKDVVLVRSAAFEDEASRFNGQNFYILLIFRGFSGRTSFSFKFRYFVLIDSCVGLIELLSLNWRIGHIATTYYNQ